MPMYDFHCRGCGHEFEALVRAHDTEPTRCPSCQSTDVERQLSTFAVNTAERHAAAVKQSRERQIKANKEKLVADEEYRREHEGH